MSFGPLTARAARRAAIFQLFFSRLTAKLHYFYLLVRSPCTLALRRAYKRPPTLAVAMLSLG